MPLGKRHISVGNPSSIFSPRSSFSFVSLIKKHLEIDLKLFNIFVFLSCHGDDRAG